MWYNTRSNPQQIFHPKQTQAPHQEVRPSQFSRKNDPNPWVPTCCPLLGHHTPTPTPTNAHLLLQEICHFLPINCSSFPPTSAPPIFFLPTIQDQFPEKHRVFAHFVSSKFLKFYLDNSEMSRTPLSSRTGSPSPSPLARNQTQQSIFYQSRSPSPCVSPAVLSSSAYR